MDPPAGFMSIRSRQIRFYRSSGLMRLWKKQESHADEAQLSCDG